MPSDMGSSKIRDSPLTPSRILIVCDATKDRSYHEFRRTINNIRMRGGIVHPGDTIVVFGVLHKVLHPSKPVYFGLIFFETVLQFFSLFFRLIILGLRSERHLQKSISSIFS